MEENYILFKISIEQAKKIAKYCYLDFKKLTEPEICALLDSIIDNLEVN